MKNWDVSNFILQRQKVRNTPIFPQNPSDREIFRQVRAQGMVTMEEDGILKVLRGVTSLEEVMRTTQEQ